MMNSSTYSSSYSSIVSLRTTTFAITNDCYSCNYPIQCCPSTYYCSCSCPFPVNSTRLMLPMNLNPSLLYGLRQSTLIQWPSYRRVVVGSSDRYCYRPSSICDVGRCCCGESCCVRKERVVGRCCCKEKFCVEKRKSVGVGVGVGRVLGRKGGEGYRVEESRSNGGDKVRGRVNRRGRDFRCNALGDAEAMLSLLSEEGVEECVPVRERKKSSFKEGKVARDQNVVRENAKDGKGNVLSGSRYSENEPKKKSAQSSRVESKKEGVKRREGRESLSIHEDQRLRRRESCSSYYSLSDSGEFQSDSEVDVKQEIFVGELSTSQGKDLRKNGGGVVISEITEDDLESYRDEKDQQLISSRHDDVRVGSSADWNWRKKSEKKLNDESTEITNSRRESIVQQSKLSQENNSSSAMASSLKNQICNLEEESTSDLRTRRQSRYSIEKDDRADEYLRSSGRHEHSATDVRFSEHSNSQIKTSNQVSDNLVSHSQHELSTSGASSSGQLKSQITIDNQVSDCLQSSHLHEQSSQTNRRNAQSVSTTMRRPIQGQGATVAVHSLQETGCDYCRTCGRSTEIAKLEVNVQQRSDSEIRGEARWNTEATAVQSQSESRYSKQEIVTSSSQRLVEQSKWDELYTAGQLDAKRTYGQHSETINNDYRYDQRISSQQKAESRIKHSDTSTSLESPEDPKNLLERTGVRITTENESPKLSQIGTSSSQVPSSSMEMRRHSASDKRIDVEHTTSTTKLKSEEELIEKHERVDETYVQTELGIEFQGTVLQGGPTAQFSGEGNTSQATVGSISQTRVPQVSQVEVQSDLQLLVTSPDQSVERNSTDSDPESIFVSKITGKTTEVGSGSGYSQSEATKTSSSDEASESGIRFVAESSPEDTINSAERMQESSSQIVGEFVDKMKHEASAFETRIEKEILHSGKKHEQEESAQLQTEKAGFSKQDLSHVSGGSGTGRLLEDMRDMKDHSVEEAPDSGSSEGEMPKSVVTRRTGKSLWNIVAGLFRLRWGSTSESQKSPVKLSQQRSSSDSASGETWFSGNDHDEDTGDGMKREQISMSQEPTSSNQPVTMETATRSRQEDRKKKQSISMLQEPISDQSPLRRSATKSKDRRKKEQRSFSQEPALDRSPPRRITSKSQKGDSRLVTLDGSLGPVQVDVSPSTSISQGGSIAGGVYIGEHTDLNMTSMPSPLGLVVPSARRLRRSDALEEIEVVEKIEERISHTSEQSEFSPQGLLVPSAGQLKGSDVFDGTVEAGRTEELISSTSELKDHFVDVMESGVSTSEETDAELKRRTLQRSKQVISRYDEWEDAYRRENEQRKVDEIFMREALAEAMRAADSWEVPVGAVLVHNGKVIARGYNLVEELRDSTAHAEMICIREASNVLQTWRLSETTLYVTLEPCPMCAGAILQARIKTLVWGAPNKLLGADGSWIRLFPDGVEGEQRLEVADKPAAPAHPFHPKMNIRRGVLESECAQIMQQFFQLRRRKETEKKKKSEEGAQPSCLPVPPNPTKLLRKMHGVFHRGHQEKTSKGRGLARVKTEGYNGSSG